MFIFRSRRANLVRRLWRLQPRDEWGSEDRRALATAVLKRLKEPALEGLVRAVEARGQDSGVCCRVPRAALRLGRRGALSPQVLTAQLFRWPEVRGEEELVRVGAVCRGEEGDLVCCNPWHWARRLDTGHQAGSTPPPHSPPAGAPLPSPPCSPHPPSPPSSPCPPSPPSSLSAPPPYSLLPPSSSSSGQLCAPGRSVATGGQEEQDTQGRLSWCTLAYWEERTRVGKLFPVHSPGVEVFAAPPRPPPLGDALSLAALAPANPRPSDATLRTREKIGLGIILSKDDSGVWAYNRTTVPVFVNSPTLDVPNSRTFTVFKIPPGFTLQIFSWSVAAHQERVREPALQDGPFDPYAVRLSFAKGWGGRYSRQTVDCCACWLEVLLRPPAR